MGWVCFLESSGKRHFLARKGMLERKGKEMPKHPLLSEGPCHPPSTCAQALPLPGQYLSPPTDKQGCDKALFFRSHTLDLQGPCHQLATTHLSDTQWCGGRWGPGSDAPDPTWEPADTQPSPPRGCRGAAEGAVKPNPRISHPQNLGLTSPKPSTSHPWHPLHPLQDHQPSVQFRTLGKGATAQEFTGAHRELWQERPIQAEWMRGSPNVGEQTSKGSQFHSGKAAWERWWTNLSLGSKSISGH